MCYLLDERSFKSLKWDPDHTKSYFLRKIKLIQRTSQAENFHRLVFMSDNLRAS